MLRSSIKTFILNHRQDGKRQTFMLDPEGLDGYINWAFINDYLFCVSDENGISGAGVAYPLPKPFDGNIESLLVFEEPLESEDNKDLVIMDWVATGPAARKGLVKQFKRRFGNWKNQRKFGIHYGKVKQLPNNYLNKIEKI